MPLPKRPSGGAIPKKVAPPQSGEQESPADVEDFALPELDDFTLPDLSFESEVPIENVSSFPRETKTPPAVADSPRERFTPSSSNNQADHKPGQTAVSDRLPVAEDEDEETRLNRELGLLDDEDFDQSHGELHSTSDESIEDDEYDEDTDEDADDLSSSLIELEEDLPETSETTEDDDDDFADLLRGLEETVGSTNDEDYSVDDLNEPESSGIVDSESTDLDADWEAALSELEALSIDVDPESDESDSDDDEEDEESEGEEEEFDLSGFVPPANPFSSVPADFDNEDDEEDDSDESDLEEDDFVPPADPFANPFASEKPKSRRSSEPEETEEEIEETSEDEEVSDTPRSGSLKGKVASALSPAKAKRGLANYFAKINAELHGEEPPKPRTDEDDEPTIDQDEELNGQPERNRRSGTKIFGFLAPVRALYAGIVNFIFGILTTVLGILAKLPLIGFIFKIALEATRVLRAIAQYIPLVFFIGGLITVSYLSVPRDSLIVLPDAGGSTFENFSYDSGSNTAAGTITNTGDIIADVQPEFEVRAIKPGLNPVSWVIPEVVSKCEAKSVRVDIDSTMNVTAKCSEPITGFFPRVTGELK